MQTSVIHNCRFTLIYVQWGEYKHNLKETVCICPYYLLLERQKWLLLTVLSFTVACFLSTYLSYLTEIGLVLLKNVYNVVWESWLVCHCDIGLNNGVSLGWDCSSKPIAEGSSVWETCLKTIYCSIVARKLRVNINPGVSGWYSPLLCHPWELLPVCKQRQLLMIVCSKCSQSNDRPAGVLPM